MRFWPVHIKPPTANHVLGELSMYLVRDPNITQWAFPSNGCAVSDSGQYCGDIGDLVEVVSPAIVFSFGSYAACAAVYAPGLLRAPSEVPPDLAKKHS